MVQLLCCCASGSLALSKPCDGVARPHPPARNFATATADLSFFSPPRFFSSVFVNSTVYVVDFEGKCTSKADPAGNPPNAIPFSMLIVDSGARGNAVKIGA